MNKLIIVGNGFDLAHGLPTSYKHFIDDFWRNLSCNYNLEPYKSMIAFNTKYSDFIENVKAENQDEFTNECRKYTTHFQDNYKKQLYIDSSKIEDNVYQYSNSLFRKINSQSSFLNWVDIENEYYQELKSIVNNVSWNKWTKKENVQVLNKEFDNIKNLLENYLKSCTLDKYDFQKGKILNFEHLLRYLRAEPLYIDDTDDEKDYLKEFPLSDKDELIAFDKRLIEARKKSDLRKFIIETQKETIFLNFNYTNSIQGYVQIMNSGNYGNYFKASEIPIHGKLSSMNFGFGDEMDDDYKNIENIDDNEYLKNFKSFKYSQNSNYKNLLDYIESNKFQVFIMGHSCGLSDRTLLNTIFEHQNCRSIKVFYHKKEDGSDNFTEIIQNISRHFNDKKMMRSKLVNKSLCMPLPQDIRFQKK